MPTSTLLLQVKVILEVMAMKEYSTKNIDSFWKNQKFMIIFIYLYNIKLRKIGLKINNW